MWVWVGEEGVWGSGGESVSLLQLAVALSVSLCGFIVPLLGRLYKYTPVGQEGDSLDSLVDGLIIGQNSTSSERSETAVTQQGTATNTGHICRI